MSLYESGVLVGDGAPLPAQASNHPAIFPVTVTLYTGTACTTPPIVNLTAELQLLLLIFTISFAE